MLWNVEAFNPDTGTWEQLPVPAAQRDVALRGATWISLTFCVLTRVVPERGR
jgi:hypothetical protein